MGGCWWMMMTVALAMAMAVAWAMRAGAGLRLLLVLVVMGGRGLMELFTSLFRLPMFFILLGGV